MRSQARSCAPLAKKVSPTLATSALGRAKTLPRPVSTRGDAICEVLFIQMRLYEQETLAQYLAPNALWNPATDC